MVRAQRKKIRSEQKQDKRFEGEGGAGVLHLQIGGQIDSGGIQAGRIRKGSHTVGRCGISRISWNPAGEPPPRVRTAMISEFREREH